MWPAGWFCNLHCGLCWIFLMTSHGPSCLPQPGASLKHTTKSIEELISKEQCFPAMVDANLTPMPCRWWASRIRWVIIFQDLCLQMFSSSLTFSWILFDKQNQDFVSPTSVWVKWWRGVVWDQVYSKDVEKSGYFSQGYFAQECQAGSLCFAERRHKLCLFP